jgi:hypothetical protein
MTSRTLGLQLEQVGMPVTVCFLIQMAICTMPANGQFTPGAMHNTEGDIHVSTKGDTVPSVGSNEIVNKYNTQDSSILIPRFERDIPPGDIVRSPEHSWIFIAKVHNSDSTLDLYSMSERGFEVFKKIPQNAKVKGQTLDIDNFSYYELLYYLSTYSSREYVPHVLKKCLREYYHIVSTNLWPVADSTGRISMKSFGKEIESLVGADSSDRFGRLVGILKKDPKGKLSEDQMKAIQILTMLYRLVSLHGRNRIPQLYVSEDSTEFIVGSDVALTYLWYDFFSGLSEEMNNYFDVGRMKGVYDGIIYPSNGTTDTSDAVAVCLYNEYSKHFMFANMRALESLSGERMVTGLKPHYSTIVSHDPVHGWLFLFLVILPMAFLTIFLLAFVTGKFRERRVSSGK